MYEMQQQSRVDVQAGRVGLVAMDVAMSEVVSDLPSVRIGSANAHCPWKRAATLCTMLQRS